MEQIRLVLEVPVDRAAGHAGVTCDVLERRARDALVEEDVLGGVEKWRDRHQALQFQVVRRPDDINQVGEIGFEHTGLGALIF